MDKTHLEKEDAMDVDLAANMSMSMANQRIGYVSKTMEQIAAEAVEQEQAASLLYVGTVVENLGDVYLAEGQTSKVCAYLPIVYTGYNLSMMH